MRRSSVERNPGVKAEAPAPKRVRSCGDTKLKEGQRKVSGDDSEQRRSPRRAFGSLSRPQYRWPVADLLPCPVRWGTKAQGTHCREGEAGHNVFLGGKMGDTS